jgi:cystathionine beta-synthase
VKSAYSISDEESFHTARELLRQEGILAGSSTGTLLAAALKYCRAQTTPEARGHLRVRHRHALPHQGLQRRLDGRPGPAAAPQLGDLRDLIGRRFDAGEVVTVAPADTLLTAFNRMRAPTWPSCR